MSRPAPWLLVLPGLAAAAGCGEPPKRWPFPPVEAAGDAGIISLLRARTAGVESLYAELSMSFEGPERSVVATAAVRYAEPGKIRMTAFKDIFVGTRSIFDLLLVPDRFVIEVEGEEGPERREGSSVDLSTLPRGFRALAVLREAMFLPGRMPPDAPATVERRGGRISVRASISSGHEVEWSLEPRTLGVETATLRLPGEAEPIRIEYSSYRQAGGVYIPEAFTLTDPGDRASVTGVLEDLEMNPALEPSDFDPAAVGRAGRAGSP
jgi:hypothetical protein